MSERKNVMVTIGCTDNVGTIDDESETPAGEFISRLQSILADVPAEYRQSARIAFNLYGDYSSAYMQLRYERPQTDDEAAAAKKRDDEYEREREDRDRKEYLRLKRKFA